jgi:hypothetical protein
MLRKIFLSLIILLPETELISQCSFYTPRHKAGGNQFTVPEESSPFAIDSSGTVYIGQIISSGTMNLGNGITLSGCQAFVAAYQNGDPVWIRGMQSTSECVVQDITVDSLKNVFVSGYYQGTMHVNSVAYGGSAMYTQGFLLKLDSLHNFVWVKTSTGNSFTNSLEDNDECNYVASDGNGGCYAIYHYVNNFKLGTVVYFNNINGGGHNSVLAHYDANGNYLWQRKIYSTTVDLVPQIVDDNHGGVYMIHNGGFSCPLDTATIVSNSQYTIYINHVTPLGRYNFVKFFQHAWYGYHSFESSSNAARCLDDGTLWMIGQFSDSVTIDTLNFTAPNMKGGYIAKMNMNGTVLDAEKILTCTTSSSEVDFGQDGFDVTPDGGFYISGLMIGAANFNGPILSDSSRNPLYVVKYDSHYHPVWLRSFGGTNPGWGGITPFGVRTSLCGSAVIGGSFDDSIRLYPVYLHSPTNLFDFYLSELNPVNGDVYYSTTDVNELTSESTPELFPDPASDHLTLRFPSNIQPNPHHNIFIYDSFGRIVLAMSPPTLAGEIEIPIETLSTGIYFLAAEGYKPVRFVKCQ